MVTSHGNEPSYPRLWCLVQNASITSAMKSIGPGVVVTGFKSPTMITADKGVSAARHSRPGNLASPCWRLSVWPRLSVIAGSVTKMLSWVGTESFRFCMVLPVEANIDDIIVRWVRDGLTSATDIANEMGVSKGTISKHVTRLTEAGRLEKTGAIIRLGRWSNQTGKAEETGPTSRKRRNAKNAFSFPD